MWKPPQRLRHLPSPGEWPTAEVAARSRLFQPIRVGPLELAQRTWVPAMVPWRASDAGFVTDRILAWYERFACGQPGAIVVEATGIRDIPSGPLLRIGHDRFLPGLQRLVATVRRASGGRTRLFIQLIDFLTVRRRPDPARYFASFLKLTDQHRAALGADAASDPELRACLAALSRARLVEVLSPRELDDLDRGFRERVTDTHLAAVRDLPQILPELFAAAAVRAVQAGFDGVELHYAHAYTMASFLSATNDRSDGYGRSREGRVRLPLEVLAAVRGATGPNVAIGCRFLTEDCIDGGSTIADSAYFGMQFAAAGMDFLSTSRGGKFDDAAQPRIGEAIYPYTGPSGYECMPQFISDERGPFGRNVAATAAVRRAVRSAGHATPVIVTGGIHNFAMAEAILAAGEADIIGAARQSLADPDWFRKVRLGRGAEVRLCQYTNYCEGLDQKHKIVTCKLWDREGLHEPDATLDDEGRRRLTAPGWS